MGGGPGGAPEVAPQRGAGEAGAPTQAGRARKEKKRKKDKKAKKKEQQQKEEPERTAEPQPAGDGDAEFLARWTFSTAFGDHFETSLPALRDAAPVLRAAAKALGLPKAKRLRVYDPYFCEGAVVGLLRGLGFKRVYNRNEDFYAVAAAQRLPAFDALLTNPPFSADHKERLLALLLAWTAERAAEPGAGRALPFALLLPSYCASKRYWQDFLEALARLRERPENGGGLRTAEARAGCFYVAPVPAPGAPAGSAANRYAFRHPLAAQRAAAPFAGVWFCGGFGDARATARALRRVRKGLARAADPPAAEVVEDLRGLEVRGLARSPEAERARTLADPAKAQKRAAALRRLDEGAARKAHKKRKKLEVRDARPVFATGAGEATLARAVEAGPKVCRHFFGPTGCTRGDRCRFSHTLPE